MQVKKRGKVVIRLILALTLLLAAGYTLYSEGFKKQEAIAAEIGSAAPDFTLQNLNGLDQRLKDYRGKGVLINFWATYCPPCVSEMPYLEHGYQQYKNQGVEVLAINVNEPTLLVNQFLSQKNVTFPILLDRDGKVAEQYKVQNLPITFLVNKDGKIIDKISGELTEEKVREYLARIKP